MIVKLDTDSIMEQMEELCSGLLQQEAFKQLRSSIDQFAGDGQATAQYERFLEKHRSLEAMDRNNLEPTDEEMQEYDKEESALYDNEVIRKFLHAQREFIHLHDRVSQLFMKSIELNRLPEPKELKKGSCGCGGSCEGKH